MLNLNLPLFEQKHAPVQILWKAAALRANSDLGHLSYCTPESGVFKNSGEDAMSASGKLSTGITVSMELALFHLSPEYQRKYLVIALESLAEAVELGPYWRLTASDDPLFYVLNWFEIAFHAALTQSYAALRVPDKTLLREWIAKVIERGKVDRIKPGRIDDGDRNGLLKICLCCLLADDLQSAHKFIKLLHTDRRYPRQYAQIKAILDATEENEYQGKPRVVIRKPEGVEAFFTLYNWLRPPDDGYEQAMYPEGRPSGQDYYLGSPYTRPVVTNYFLTWIYLQCVEPEPIDQIDRETLHRLMCS